MSNPKADPHSIASDVERIATSSRQPNITIELRPYNTLVIKYGNTLHLRIDRSEVLCIQSWICDKNFWIEYSMRGGSVILSEYDTESHWRAILDGLEAVLDGTKRPHPQG